MKSCEISLIILTSENVPLHDYMRKSLLKLSDGDVVGTANSTTTGQLKKKKAARHISVFVCLAVSPLLCLIFLRVSVLQFQMCCVLLVSLLLLENMIMRLKSLQQLIYAKHSVCKCVSAERKMTQMTLGKRSRKKSCKLRCRRLFDINGF